MQSVEEVITLLRSRADASIKASQDRFGINTYQSLGLNVPAIRAIAKQIGTNHSLALQLWKTRIHEARHIATMVADPDSVTEKLMEQWVKDFNSWDIVDGCCSSLFRKTPFAYAKAMEWCERKPEFEKRAGFSMMCYLAVHDKKEKDKKFEQFLPYIYKHSNDERNFVKKAVNWALRQVGKRNERLCKKAIAIAKKIKTKEGAASKWIAADALRELEKYLKEGKIKSVGEK